MPEEVVEDLPAEVEAGSELDLPDSVVNVEPVECVDGVLMLSTEKS